MPSIIEQYKVASYSSLKMLDSFEGAPIKLKQYRETKRTEDSDAQRYGKALDVAVLQPDSFKHRFKVFTSIPKTDTVKFKFVKLFLYAMSRNASRAAAIKFAKKYSGINRKLSTLDKSLDVEGEYGPEIHWLILSKQFTPLNPVEYDSVMWAAESALSSPIFAPYLQDPNLQIQQWVEWTNPATGVRCHGEPDMFVRGSWVGDLKSAMNAAPAKFGGRFGELRRFKYGEQVYAMGEALGEPMETERLIFVVEKQAPHACSLIKISDDDLYHFRENWIKWCATFKHVHEHALWDMGYEYFQKFEPYTEYNPESGELFGGVRDGESFDGIYETQIFG